MREAGLRPYAKLLDRRYAAVELRSADVRALAQAHFTGADPTQPRGPTAIVVHSQSALDLGTLYDERSRGSGRALAIFTDRGQAVEWLNATNATWRRTPRTRCAEVAPSDDVVD